MTTVRIKLIRITINAFPLSSHRYYKVFQKRPTKQETAYLRQFSIKVNNFFHNKKVHRNCSNILPFTSIQTCSLFTMLSKLGVNGSFFINLISSSIRFFKSSIFFTCVLYTFSLTESHE